MNTDTLLVKKVYTEFVNRVAQARQVMGRPLTYAEKVLMVHLVPLEGQNLNRKKSTVLLAPDRVAMQDATAQMALLQFMSSGIKQVQVPSTVHCDHLIRAHSGVEADLKIADSENAEVFHFLSSVAQKFGLGFWKPGAGIIHQVVLENYAFPGGMMIGTDSHTPNAGGLGMIAIGVGGADAVDVMVGEPFMLKWPGLIGVKLTGQLQGWTSAKDVILKVCEILTVKGGTGSIVEYFGEGTKSISATGKATICNMGAEHGATTSIFPYDTHTKNYLQATGRHEWASVAEQMATELCADADVEKNPHKYFDQIIEINLSTLEPQIVGPHTPDLCRPVSALKNEIKDKGYPSAVTFALIGSCTNSSYEDMDRSASIVQAATKNGLKLKMPLFISPGSDQIFNTIKRDGQLKIFTDAGAVVLSNACGPCIGQWQRDDMPKGVPNNIVTSFNRNFRARNDGNPDTNAFIASPEMVTAYAFSGELGFNPQTDTIKNEQGIAVKLNLPVGESLPKNLFDMQAVGFVASNPALQATVVTIAPNSDRLQALAPFAKWDGQDYFDCVLLLKAKGKCTTDHISPAGPWLKFRGHLDNISNNMFTGATNFFTGETGLGQNVLTKDAHRPLPENARAYKKAQVKWIVVGDENYGEGSSREHAAMEPRFLGGVAVLVKSFARIHETNLKKQGVLPLTFANPADYDTIDVFDKFNILGLSELAEGKPLTVEIKKPDGKLKSTTVLHTLTAEQILWFKAGSALNKIASALADA